MLNIFKLLFVKHAWKIGLFELMSVFLNFLSYEGVGLGEVQSFDTWEDVAAFQGGGFIRFSDSLVEDVGGGVGEKLGRELEAWVGVGWLAPAVRHFVFANFAKIGAHIVRKFERFLKIIAKTTDLECLYL